ncbi:MAG: 3-phosphoserine/phosphohydroxythreonine transaminase [Gammaproteobacteria bacterium]|nr:MAG: 3-phosphoserine/phosphohydroxythreonine transaminase [Gammaproteobacteria bacterium]
MARVFNFSAGPATIAEDVLKKAQEELLDWNGTGMSVMEMSHRGKDYVSIAEKAEADLRELMNIPAGYKVLFLQGGATGQFAAIPMNILRGKKAADYVCTGSWSKKAIAEGKKYCDVNVVSQPEKFNTIPEVSEWNLSADAAYLHICSNETIEGVEFKELPECGEVPLVADMSSNILSRPIDVSKFGIIYAGTQKNIGPAGMAIAIVREDLIGDALPTTPSVLDYQKQADNDSMLNTPPTYTWYMAGLAFQNLKKIGGLEAIAEINDRKAAKLYDCIDASDFYANPVDPKYRSVMNVPFTLADDSLDAAFLDGAKKEGLVTLKGHRSIGGMRASIYNAMPEEGIDALIAFMKEFERTNG